MASEDYGTFSAAVDHVVQRAGKSPLRDDVASLARQVIRSSQTLSDFPEDRSETSFVVPTVPYQWNVPSGFRKIERAHLTNRLVGTNEYFRFDKLPPGNLGTRPPKGGSYYRGGNVVVFGGHQVGDTIGISYFSYLPPLPDFGEILSQRPWRYDLEAQQWIDQRGNYGLLTDGSPDPRSESPLEMSTNWLLFDWFELVVKGAMSAILNATDDPRGPRVFAEYTALMTALKRGAVE